MSLGWHMERRNEWCLTQCSLNRNSFCCGWEAKDFGLVIRGIFPSSKTLFQPLPPCPELSSFISVQKRTSVPQWAQKGTSPLHQQNLNRTSNPPHLKSTTIPKFLAAEVMQPWSVGHRNIITQPQSLGVLSHGRMWFPSSPVVLSEQPQPSFPSLWQFHDSQRTELSRGINFTGKTSRTTNKPHSSEQKYWSCSVVRIFLLTAERGRGLNTDHSH